MARRILIVEDDTDIARLLELHLRDMGHETTLAADGARGLREASDHSWDLIILDLMLPAVDGLEICRRVRARPKYTPIMMLTCKSSERDRVLGLEVGADDYMTKPFSIREFRARIKALFRRVEAMSAEAVAPDDVLIEAGDLSIDPVRHLVTRGGRPLHLTAKEFDLLHHFARHPGRVLTRAALLDSVWGYGYEGYEHTVNSHINRLRAKLEEDPSHPRYILTVRGVGYKFADNEADTAHA